jgi:hypothetical protein
MTAPQLPALRAQDDTVRGHIANAMQLLLCEQSAEDQAERELCLMGARRRLRWALDLLERENAAALERRSALHLQDRPA